MPTHCRQPGGRSCLYLISQVFNRQHTAGDWVIPTHCRQPGERSSLYLISQVFNRTAHNRWLGDTNTLSSAWRKIFSISNISSFQSTAHSRWLGDTNTLSSAWRKIFSISDISSFQSTAHSRWLGDSAPAQGSSGIFLLGFLSCRSRKMNL